MPDTIAGVSAEAVENATGHSWEYWLALLDDHDGTDLDHKERVAVIAEAGVDSGWWQQQLAVGYEQARDLREVGETADADFQVGVQRTLSVDQETLWEFLTSMLGRAHWLGDLDTSVTEPQTPYKTADGTTGEIRTVRERERIRLTWQPAYRDDPTTLQLNLADVDAVEPKTVLSFHHEKLADAEEREAMRNHWREVLDTIEADLETSNAD